MSGEIDTWYVERDGIKWRIDIDPDHDSDTTDIHECPAEVVVAWGRGEWRFVGVTVSPVIDGIDGEWISESLWAVEWGELPGVTGTNRERIEEYPVGDLIDECRARLIRVRDALDHV